MLRAFPIMIALSGALVAMPAAADKPSHAGKGQHKKAAVHHVSKSDHDRSGRSGRGIAHPVYAQDCPPGLAKKTPRCVPPGLAKKDWPAVGRVVRGDVHYITRPGLYGLGLPPDGSRYAVVDGHLVRVDSSTQRVLSIIRLVNAILD